MWQILARIDEETEAGHDMLQYHFWSDLPATNLNMRRCKGGDDIVWSKI